MTNAERRAHYKKLHVAYWYGFRNNRKGTLQPVNNGNAVIMVNAKTAKARAKCYQ